MKILGKTLRPDRVARHVRDRLALTTMPPRGRAVALVGDGAAWSIRDDQLHLGRQLRGLGYGVRHIRDITAARGKLVHVLDRQALLKLDPARVHPGNRLVLTWYHGAPEDAEFAEGYAALRRWLPRLTAVVTSCQTTRQDLIRGGVDPGRIAVVPLGVDPQAFAPPDPAQRREARRRWGVADDEIAVGSFQKDGVGWGEGQAPKLIKGPDLLLQTLARWRESLPEVRLKILLTGPARGYVKQGLDRLGLPWVHRQYEKPAEVADAYRALDLYVIAARCEGGPKALLEAWASGVAVAAQRVGMVSDWLVDGRSGRSVAVGDTAALAEACRQLTEDPDLRRRCVEQGRQSAQGLTWRHAARALAGGVYGPAARGEPPTRDGAGALP